MLEEIRGWGGGGERKEAALGGGSGSHAGHGVYTSYTSQLLPEWLGVLHCMQRSQCSKPSHTYRKTVQKLLPTFCVQCLLGLCNNIKRCRNENCDMSTATTAPFWDFCITDFWFVCFPPVHPICPILPVVGALGVTCAAAAAALCAVPNAF